MTDLVVETPEGVALRFELAGAGTRILAAALDGLILVLGFVGTALVLRLAGLGFGYVLLTSGFVLVVVAYSFLFPLFLGARTPGKLWVGIRVCDAQGFAPSVSQLFLRALFVPLEAFLIVPVPVVWILVAATPRHQRLGDLVAGTLVLRERTRRAPREPVPGLSWSALETHAFALDPGAVRALTGHDLGFLRDLLTRADLEPRARARLFEQAAQRYARRIGLERAHFDAGEARTFLRELFLLLREVRAEGRALTPSAAPPADGAAAPGAPRASGSAPR